MDYIKAVEQPYLRDHYENVEIGDRVNVHLRITEGSRERIQVFEGTVIGRKGAGLNETVTVRRVAYGVGVERVFPLHSPKVVKIDVLRKGRVRRAKLFYLRDRVGKAGVEGAQKHLRRILEKGSSFDHLSQEKLNQITAHLNGMNRKKLNDISPTDSFSFLFGREVLSLLGIPELPPDRVSLKPRVAD
jgi:large subunit ribosomal protein L19